MKLSLDHGGPPYLRLIAPFEVLPGCRPVEAIQDLWWHSLLGEHWAPAVERIDYAAAPLEMILPRPRGPRQVSRGLAVFAVAAQGLRASPSLLPSTAPLLQVAQAPTYIVEVLADRPPEILRLLADPSSANGRAGPPRRSVLSTSTVKWLCMEWALPPAAAPLELELLWRHLRRVSLPLGTMFGSVALCADRETLLCEMTSAEAALHAWDLSTQLVALSADKLVLHTGAPLDVWRPKLARLMQQDAQATILRQKWRPSRCGGRPWATPAAAPTQLAVARRAKGGRLGQAAPLRHVAEVHACGSPGYDARDVHRQLMAHLGPAAGVQLVESSTGALSALGCWCWPAAADPMASPGRVRLYLQSEAEVQAVHGALHEKTTQVGTDLVALRELRWQWRSFKQFLFKHFFSLLFFYAFAMQILTLISAMGLLMMCRTRSAPGRDCEQRVWEASSGGRSLWLHGMPKHCLPQIPRGFVRRLAGAHDAVRLTETHGVPGAPEAWRGPQVCWGWWSHGAAARAGVGALLQERFANQFPEREWVEIDPGRSAVLRLGGPQGHSDLVVAYFPAGDFNWVTEDADRVALRTGSASGARDRAEERHWRRVALQLFSLHELHQLAMTHRSGSARSRLDQLYCNQDLSEQFDQDLFAAALEWQPELSRHRAVAAGRRVHSASRPVTAAAVQLSLLKDAACHVAEGISRELQTGRPAEATEGKVGLATQPPRAVEGGHAGRISKCIERYPELAKLAGNHPYSPELRQAGRWQAVRSHAVELARERAVEELQRFSDDLPSLDAGEAAVRRGRNWRLISRLAPGRCQSIQAVMDPAGAVRIEPAAIAQALRDHWGEVFKARPLSRSLRRRWLGADRRARGPDGLPFVAWKRLGPLAVDVLFAVHEQLSSPDAEESIQRDCPGYNDSLMVFLPKTPTSESDDGISQFALAGARRSGGGGQGRGGAKAAATLEPLSGLRLNLGKTVRLPLRLGDPDGVRLEVASRAPSWGGLRFARKAKYLGFLVGPARGEQGWDAASAEYLQRARERGRSGGGMFANTIGYSMYAFSTMSFLAQLGAPPLNWGQLESAALQSLYAGPNRSASAAALHCLPLPGFLARLPDLPATALAATHRVRQSEAAAEGGPRAAARTTELRATRLHST
ncbi:unnamed protein product, partial [Prorocentrum cordatum]